ncbi:MAG TPA: hypothetical protein VMV53_11265 [Acidimicrobiales bacterium]|nr:hypothetical protein [Acidimicrobiales bacterium]
MASLWHWFLHVTGASNEGGTAYGFWSGFGADIEEFGVVVLAVGVYRRHKCKSCWRPALKGGVGRVKGTHFETCHLHTNEDQHEQLTQLHRLRHGAMHDHLNQ